MNIFWCELRGITVPTVPTFLNYLYATGVNWIVPTQRCAFSYQNYFLSESFSSAAKNFILMLLDILATSDLRQVFRVNTSIKDKACYLGALPSPLLLSRKGHELVRSDCMGRGPGSGLSDTGLPRTPQ